MPEAAEEERQQDQSNESLALGLSLLMLRMLFLIGKKKKTFYKEKSVMRNCLQHSAPEPYKVSPTDLSMILVLIFVASRHNDTLHNAGIIPLLLLG